jgi:hypothetical protein
MFGRKSSPSSPPLIHPDEWPAQTGKARVLIENPDRADLWAHADLLREAGYDVAMCGGPTPAPEPVTWFRRLFPADSDPVAQERTVCPLVAHGDCPLADGADVVVSTTALTDSREIHATLSARSAPALVVEGTTSDLDRSGGTIGDAVKIALPVLPAQLVDAVERARSNP